MSNGSEPTERKSIGPGVKVVVAAIALLCLIFIIYLFTKGNTTTTRDPSYEQPAKVTSVFCSGSGIVNDIYSYGDPISTTQEVTAIFHDSKLHDLTLAFNAQYNDNATAVSAEAVTHANFLIFLTNVSSDGVFDEHFGVDGDKIIANVYAESDKITTANAAALLMWGGDKDTRLSAVPSTPSEVSSVYTAEGFYCEKEK